MSEDLSNRKLIGLLVVLPLLIAFGVLGLLFLGIWFEDIARPYLNTHYIRVAKTNVYLDGIVTVWVLVFIFAFFFILVYLAQEPKKAEEAPDE